MAPRFDAHQKGGQGAAALAPLPRLAPLEKDNYVPSTLRYYYIPKVGEKYTGLLGDHHKERSFFQRVDWISFVALTLTPILGAYGVLTTPFDWRTYAFAVFWYFVTGIGITAGASARRPIAPRARPAHTSITPCAGYHRLFAHRAYKATTLGRALLCVAGSGAVEGSVLWWSRGHRAHHK
jgi:fatty-acid desaturase